MKLTAQLAAALAMALPQAVWAQQRSPVAVSHRVAAQAPAESARVVRDTLSPKLLRKEDKHAGHRDRNAVIGGAIGAVVGIGMCNALRNMEGDGSSRSHCSFKGNAVGALVGFSVGLMVGGLIP